jgi:hypothetical protein
VPIADLSTTQSQEDDFFQKTAAGSFLKEIIFPVAPAAGGDSSLFNDIRR